MIKIILILIGIVLTNFTLIYITSIDINKNTVEFCQSPESLEKYTPLIVGSDIKIRFIFKNNELIVDIDGIYTEIIAIVVSNKIYIKNTDLWKLFEWYCIHQYREEYEFKISMYSLFLFIINLLLVIVCIWILVNNLRTRKISSSRQEELTVVT
ncbi:MAG: hypothetical protein QXL19_05870 [Ignisphaera sp.]